MSISENTGNSDQALEALRAELELALHELAEPAPPVAPPTAARATQSPPRDPVAAPTHPSPAHPPPAPDWGSTPAPGPRAIPNAPQLSPHAHPIGAPSPPFERRVAPTSRPSARPQRPTRDRSVAPRLRPGELSPPRQPEAPAAIQHPHLRLADPDPAMTAALDAPPPAAGAVDPDDQADRSLYAEYVQIKEDRGELTGDLTWEWFQALLRRGRRRGHRRFKLRISPIRVAIVVADSAA